MGIFKNFRLCVCVCVCVSVCIHTSTYIQMPTWAVMWTENQRQWIGE